MPRAKREDGKNARTVASNKYQKNNYDRINILAPLNYKEKVKEYAEKADLSISAYIVKAIRKRGGKVIDIDELRKINQSENIILTEHARNRLIE